MLDRIFSRQFNLTLTLLSFIALCIFSVVNYNLGGCYATMIIWTSYIYFRHSWIIKNLEKIVNNSNSGLITLVNESNLKHFDPNLESVSDLDQGLGYLIVGNGLISFFNENIQVNAGDEMHFLDGKLRVIQKLPITINN